MPVRHPNESPEYAKLRAELLEAEIALRDQGERVAALRRTLPLDTVVADETLEEIVDGERVPVKLSELFSDPAKPLVLMHFMYGASMAHPCPMCTMWADGYDGVVPHLEQRMNFAVLVAGDVGDFAATATSASSLPCAARVNLTDSEPFAIARPVDVVTGVAPRQQRITRPGGLTGRSTPIGHPADRDRLRRRDCGRATGASAGIGGRSPSPRCKKAVNTFALSAPGSASQLSKRRTSLPLGANTSCCTVSIGARTAGRRSPDSGAISTAVCRRRRHTKRRLKVTSCEWV